MLFLKPTRDNSVDEQVVKHEEVDHLNNFYPISGKDRKRNQWLNKKKIKKIVHPFLAANLKTISHYFASMYNYFWAFP